LGTVEVESRAYHCYKEGDCSYARKEKNKPVLVTGCNDFDLFFDKMKPSRQEMDAKWFFKTNLIKRFFLF
jgi:hypothetical protein